jgi:hypothetical protein
MTSSPHLPTDVRTLTDLSTLWERVQSLAESPATRPCLWLAFLDPAGERQPAIVAFDDVPDRPEPSDAEALRAVLTDVADRVDVAHVAALLERQGDRRVSDDDRAWAGCLAGIGLTSGWPMHVAVRGHVRVLAPDDLLGSVSSETS